MENIYLFAGFDHPLRYVIIDGIHYIFVNLLNISVVDKETPELLFRISQQHVGKMRLYYLTASFLVKNNPGHGKPFDNLEGFIDQKYIELIGTISQFNGKSLSDLKKASLKDLYLEAYKEYIRDLANKNEHNVIFVMCEAHTDLSKAIIEEFGERCFVNNDQGGVNPNGIVCIRSLNLVPQTKVQPSYIEYPGRKPNEIERKAQLLITMPNGKIIGGAHFPADFENGQRIHPSRHFKWAIENKVWLLMADTNDATDVTLLEGWKHIGISQGFGHTEVSCGKNKNCIFKQGKICESHELVGIFEFKD